MATVVFFPDIGCDAMGKILDYSKSANKPNDKKQNSRNRLEDGTVVKIVCCRCRGKVFILE